jgi:Zn-dependent metalloprotease
VKLLSRGLALAMVGAGLAAAPAITVQAAPAAQADDNGVRAMKNEATGLVSLSGESATKRVGFIRVERGGDLMPARAGRTRDDAVAKSDAYLDKYAANFGARAGELRRAGVEGANGGWTVTYTQSYRGVPVFGSMLRAQVDEQGDLTAVNGYAAPSLDLSVTPRLSASDAAENAVGTVRSDPPGHEGDADTTGIEAASTDLVVYRVGATKGEAGRAILAWAVEVSNRANVRDMVFLDASTGKLVNRYSLIHDGLYRELYEESYSRKGLRWSEGDRFPARLDVDQQNEVLATGESYWFFKNAFGRDSYDGEGHKMITVNNDPRISCPNANWNGVTTNYCSGVSSDDVVAHEWGHAYTEYTHGLIYQWQSGALNESYSDIWGETVDLVNGRMDADEGDISAARPVGQCSTHSPATPVVVINSPASIAKTCEAGAAQFGAQLDGTGITGDVVLGTDGSGATNDACEPLTNAGSVAGKVALVDRGTCAFTIKVKNAQAAGAKAVLVADNVEATPGGMSGSDPSITIPSVRIRLSDGNLIKSALPNGAVNITMKDAAGDRGDSYRWLMGEDSTAFGGAIRDMWSPTCYGDPGKVSDAQYYCASDDGGGVHSNSGVPNHGYALLVDGGTYNGVEVKGIGLDKAAAIYWRAMTAYQTPTSDFADHADALEASCQDLVGRPINRLTTAAQAAAQPAQSVRTSDCAQVKNIVAAVELRQDPVQCNFKPLLDPNTPTLCGEGGTETQVWSEDFEDGLTGWTADQQVVFSGGFGAPWEASTDAPGDHAGGVAHGPAPDRGECSNGAGDFSSRDSITSPPVQVPAGDQSVRMAFDHYVSTETGYDGGNVKVSINGGGFAVIPASAYLFNRPTKLTAASTNTNPMAGEEGFTGTDGGRIGGSWGTSQIDLGKVGVAPGDTVAFRFDIGRDGCGGLEGWYVDNIEVVACALAAASTASSTASLEGRRG